MRYFAELAYNGTNYSGWQVQPNANSLQAEIEKGISTILNTPTPVLGCGRTDAGVHASQFFMHFEGADELPEAFVNRLNKFLPKDIAFRRIYPVADDLHARFDAKERSYEYHIDYYKNPFRTNTAFFYYGADQLDLERLQAAAKILLDYKEFTPFCKTNSDAKTMFCELFRSEWEIDEKAGKLIFHITANRFLRGMVRLIVGACILAAENRIELSDIKDALDHQTPLKRTWSVPPQGLYLSKVVYP